MPTSEEEAAQKAADETKAKDDAAKAQGKTFTQAELDAIIKERLDRAEEKTKKDRAAEALKIEQETAAKNGEWQKVAETREKESAQAKADAESARAELTEERTKNATLAAAGKPDFGDGATKQKFINPAAAYVYIKATNPAITADGIPDALKALAKENPWMLEGAATQQQQSNPGPTRGRLPNQQTITQAQQDAINKKRQSYPPL